MELGQSKRLTRTAEETSTSSIERNDAVSSEALAYTRTLVIDLSRRSCASSVYRRHFDGWASGCSGMNLMVTVQIEVEDLPLPEDQAVLLFQSVRELLMNTIKHARSDTASVRMQQESGSLRIEVRDEGVGFDLEGDIQTSICSKC